MDSTHDTESWQVVEICRQGYTLSYRWKGVGTHAIIFFHGFGQSSEAMMPLAEEIKTERIMLISVDLFFHGKSNWKDVNKVLTKEEWGAVMKDILNSANIETMDIVSFSMGARFGLVAVERMPARVKQLILVAPDGIAVSMWYKLATHSSVARRLFLNMVSKRNSFKRLIGIVRHTGLVHKSALKFAKEQMNTKAKRQKVYNTWVVFRKMFAGVDLIKLINNHKIKVTVITGKFDRVLPYQRIEKVVDQFDQCLHLSLKSGHGKLLEETKNEIGDLLT